ncbi:MAG: trypsin-like peptidase domain-containing protein [Pirellula sp.]
MSNTIKTPKSAYIILGVGVALGTIATASILGGYTVGKAYAQRTSIRTIGNISGENMAMLRNIDGSFAGLAEYIEPAVVNIRVQSSGGTDMFGNRLGQVGGEGSGVIIRPDGWILTNDHVVGGMDKVTVTLNDGREFSGTVRRSDYSDLAVVKIDAKELPSVQFADSNRVRPGQFAIAVGSPFGLENSVTIGHVSALSRDSRIGDDRTGTQRVYPDLIQTDAAINQGNSGGPLLDIEGRVIGINTAIFSGTGGSVGIGFAIPANQARLTAEALIEKGKIVRGFFGVDPANLKGFQKAELGVSEGALIKSFGESNMQSPARTAGLKEGDVITKIGGLTIASHADLRNAMFRYGPGETINVEYVRNKVRHTVSVKLSAPPAPPTTPIRPKIGGHGNDQLNVPNESPTFPDLDQMFPKGQLEPQPEGKVPPVREGKARLGVTIEALTATNRTQFHVPKDVNGVTITSVEPGSVAAKLGLKIGDVIQMIGDQTVTSPEDVAKALTGVKWGDSKRLRYSRYGAQMQMTNEVDALFR